MFSRIDGLRDGANLVSLHDAPGVRHQEVVVHDLHVVAARLAELAVGGPVVLFEGVLDGREGILVEGREGILLELLLVVGAHFLARLPVLLLACGVLEVQVVLAFLVELQNVSICADTDLGLVAYDRDLPKAGGAHGKDHELLAGQAIAGVNDIEGGHRHHVLARETLGEDRVGVMLKLDVDPGPHHHLVGLFLLGHVHALKLGREDVVRVLHGHQDGVVFDAQRSREWAPTGR